MIDRYVRIAWLLFVWFTACAASADEPKPFGLEQRMPWVNARLAGSPEPPLSYTVERRFEKLTLKAPVYILPEPDTNCLLVVLYGNGQEPSRIVRFVNEPQVEKFEAYFEQANRLLYAICPDPNYATNRLVYLFTNGPTSEPERQDRVTRYRVVADPTPHIDPASELVLLEWRSAGHDGGDLAFGLDGMLYITTGDGTSDSDGWNSGQTVDDLLGSVLRIDVREATPEKLYRVPPDNPFVDLPGARGEVWAYGLRNPWRMGIDPKTGYVWVGNNGQDLWETAHLVRKGENYGWSVYEGSHPFHPQRKRGPTPLVPPTIEHSHAEFRSLTGGVVYHGRVLPELEGAYIYGDYSSGRIWGMKHDGTRPLWHRELADTSLGLAAFRVDQQGQLLIADHAGGIYRLIEAPKVEPAAPFPAQLSETGLFASTAEHRAVEGLIPYSVNAPGWSDGTTAERFMAVPSDATVEYRGGQGSWTFPNGTALVQTLSLPTSEGQPPVRIETRVLLRQQGEWDGYTYRWNAEQTDATLVPKEGADAELSTGASTPSDGKHKWRFPSRAECMTCHSRAANFVLGICESQLNRDHPYPGGADNQLRALDHVGLFKDKLPKPPAELSRFVDPYDESQELAARARTYLHVNCSVCHVAAGGGNARMELPFATQPEKLELIEARPQHDSFGIANAMLVAPGESDRSVLVHRLSVRGRGQMPPLVTQQVDRQGLNLMRQWIAQMKPLRPLVRAWQMDDLRADVETLSADRSRESGQTLFRQTGCAQCHRFSGEGGFVGPDLTQIGKRLSKHELLEAILEPSKKIADEYATYLVQTEDGEVVSGQIEREDDHVLVLRPAEFNRTSIEIEKKNISGRRKSEASNMPAGIVNVLQKEELLDLLAYLLSQQAP